MRGTRCAHMTADAVKRHFKGICKGSVERFELPPRAIRFVGSKLNGAFPGYVGRLPSRGTETSISFMMRSATLKESG